MFIFYVIVFLQWWALQKLRWSIIVININCQPKNVSHNSSFPSDPELPVSEFGINRKLDFFAHETASSDGVWSSSSSPGIWNQGNRNKNSRDCNGAKNITPVRPLFFLKTAGSINLVSFTKIASTQINYYSLLCDLM